MEKIKIEGVEYEIEVVLMTSVFYHAIRAIYIFKDEEGKRYLSVLFNELDYSEYFHPITDEEIIDLFEGNVDLHELFKKNEGNVKTMASIDEVDHYVLTNLKKENVIPNEGSYYNELFQYYKKNGLFPEILKFYEKVKLGKTSGDF